MRERQQRGPYGPNNPPPPPVAPPPEAYEHQRAGGRGRPNRKVRQRSYAKAEAEFRGIEQERRRSRSPVHEPKRMRGRSPARPRDFSGESPRYREPTPMRRESVSIPSHKDNRRDDGIRCFCCNEPGHKAADCSIATHFGKKACFRCGETGHIARACKVRVGQVKPEVEHAGDESNRGFNGDCNDDQGDDVGQSSLPKVTADGRLSTNTWSDQEQLSVSPSCAGYYVEDEVDWGEDDDDALTKSEKPDQYHIHPQREAMVQEPFLGLPHFKNADVDGIPATVQDLRGYDYRIKVMYERKPKNQRFINGGNGKVAPALYGSEQRHDLGLCFATFLTRKRCEMGVNCPWRHHPLSNAEKAWIIEYGKKKGKEFIDNNDRWWSYPEVPVPGANMQGFGDKDT
ncbi:hypothetical protein AA0119_g10673 [Alternaria tenuissima]|uniref:CCHC-type domain-containing protein n=1 Tax=Alternaria tenuissima TaxID=119927 RepID=A0A4V1WUD3_9PLEO|nr:hypothetical protein AA0115_g1869 [Alternaria tenuissima]RYN91185.1 hypothetical protein AA0119_g10673 [Alternaria tenuissima]RYO56114.1 hypothetical protein AA0116_g8557 [Alternaria tenuissima]